jgi:hypothetical protein
VGFDGGVVESIVEQEGSVCAGSAGVGDGVGSGVHEGAGDLGVVRIDNDCVPVLAEEDDAAAGSEDSLRLRECCCGAGDFVEYLVGAR